MARKIEAMLAEGTTQREVSEHFGFKDKYVVKRLLGRQRERSFGTYGYRRMWLWLKSQNICCNPKTVLLYLSMIRDLCDNSIVAYKTGTRQTVNLVLDTIRLAVKQEKKAVAVELQLKATRVLNTPLRHILS